MSDAKDRLTQVCWMADGVYHTEYFKPPVPISVTPTKTFTEPSVKIFTTALLGPSLEAK